MESFARFGARLDTDTRRVIEHGKRIRACLKQAQFSPVPVPAQIAILLALHEGLFDPVPIERMQQAELAVREAAANIPAALGEKLATAAKFAADDRDTIVDIARRALKQFIAEPEAGKQAES